MIQNPYVTNSIWLHKYLDDGRKELYVHTACGMEVLQWWRFVGFSPPVCPECYP